MEGMNGKGFVKLYRGITEWEWYDDVPTKVVWLHCLVKANWQDRSWHGQTIKRGSFITSIAHLAEETKLTTNQVRRALNNLRETGEIKISTTNKYTAVTVEKYEKYQDRQNENHKQITNEPQTNHKQTTTTKEIKEIKEIKEEYRASFRPPTIDELRGFIEEHKLCVDAETFLDHYRSCGWMIGKGKPMKDWRAACRNWHRRDGGKTMADKEKSARGKQEQAKREAELEAEWAKEFERRPRASKHDIEHLKQKYGFGKG